MKTKTTEDVAAHAPLISWRAVFGGFFIALLVYWALIYLGVGIGGLSLENAIEEREGLGALSFLTVLWIGVSSAIAVFAGAYVAARISSFVTTRVDASQGLVVVSLFFLFMAGLIALSVSAATIGLSNLVGSIGGTTLQGLASNPKIASTVEQGLRTVDLKNNYDDILAGVSTRLINGDTRSAAHYLAQATGISEAEALTKINLLNDQVTATMQKVGEEAAQATSKAGWGLLTLLVLSSVAAILGGMAGGRANVSSPLVANTSTTLGYGRSSLPAAT